MRIFLEILQRNYTKVSLKGKKVNNRIFFTLNEEIQTGKGIE